MAMETSFPLQRMSREQLASILLSEEASKVAVIDVRDNDHVGGHIHTSTHVPTPSLDYRIPEIVRTLADKDIVVFHCALSQQRGPSAAMRYQQERERKVKKGEVATNCDVGIKDGQLQKIPSEETRRQEVYILDRGFVGWQEK